MSHLLSFSLLFSFFWFFISIAAQSNPTNYPTCPSYNCGHLNISYPFWRIDDDQPQYCGFQDLGINCSTINGRDFPIIHINGVSYYVDNIIHETDSIILIDYDVSPIVPLPVRNYCQMVPHEIDFQSLPFNFTPYNVNLSFHFNCTEIPNFATEIPCWEWDSGRRKSCVNVMRLETKDFDWSNYSCEEDVVKTVLGNNPILDGDRLGREYDQVLSRGFELKWGRPEGCDKCVESDGRCGYNNITAESMCFCSDGRTTTDNCNTKKGTFIGNKNFISLYFVLLGPLIM